MYTFEKGFEVFDRAKKVIPKGIYGHLGINVHWPQESFPPFSGKAEGAYFWDTDGNRYLDFMCAYGPSILGYCDPEVDNAGIAEIRKGNTISRPSHIMVDFAEKLVDTIDSADWALFAKNGGDVTSLAVMVSRAATGRKKVILVNDGYHGVAPWAQKKGVNKDAWKMEQANNIYVEWNDVKQVEKAIAENKGEIACFISTPYHHPSFFAQSMPAKGYWKKIRKLCTNNGIVLAIDDVRCGFRLDIAGSDKYFGFKADLICYCKALANGWPVSALLGTDALRSACEDVFHTGSYWMQSAPFAAGIACIEKLKKLDAPKYMHYIGKKYCDGLVELAKRHGYEMEVTGDPSLFYLILKQHPGKKWSFFNDYDRALQIAWTAENSLRGVYLTNHHNHFINCAMTENDIDFALDVADQAFKAVKQKF